MIKQHKIERYFISAALLLAMIFFSYSAFAFTPNNLPSKNDIKSSLTALNKKSSLSEEEKLVRGDLEKTSDFYNELDKLEQRTEELQKKLNRTNEESRVAVQGLQQVRNESQQQSSQFAEKIKTSSLSQLEALQATYLENLQSEQNDLCSGTLNLAT